MKIVFSFCLLFAMTTASGQTARTISVQDLKGIIETRSDTVRVINFWATWCGPCVKELPLFEALAKERPDLKVILVSLDLDIDPDQEKIHNFVRRRSLRNEVLILEPADANVWIDEIEKDWSGAIPATIIINGKTGERKFIERALKEGELQKYIDEVTKS